jgi:hypothetical protein
LPNYVDAGAGLARLPDWPLDSDFIFDSLFPYEAADSAFAAGESIPDFPANPMIQAGPMVRTYPNNAAM